MKLRDMWGADINLNEGHIPGLGGHKITHGQISEHVMPYTYRQMKDKVIYLERKNNELEGELEDLKEYIKVKLGLPEDKDINEDIREIKRNKTNINREYEQII